MPSPNAVPARVQFTIVGRIAAEPDQASSSVARRMSWSDWE